MDTFLEIQDYIDIYEYKMDKASVLFNEIITEYYEEYENTMPFTEATNDNLFIKLKKVIANMITAIIEFVSSIKLELQTTIQSISYKNALRSLQKELKEKKAEGVNSVQVQDIWTLSDTYIEAVSKLRVYTKRFAKMEYKNTNLLEQDLDAFNELYTEYEKKIEDAIDKTTIISVDNMIQFIEDECSGNGKLMTKLENTIVEFKEMGNAALALSKKADILGPDIIQKRTSIIHKIISKFTGLLKKIMNTIVNVIKKMIKAPFKILKKPLVGGVVATCIIIG